MSAPTDHTLNPVAPIVPPTRSLSSLDLSSPSPSPSPSVPPTTLSTSTDSSEIIYRAYQGEQDLVHIVSLVDDELSEPYNLYTYRYFLDTWPHLCFFAFSAPSDSSSVEGSPLGVIISKLEPHSKSSPSSLIPLLSPLEECAWTSTTNEPVLIDQETGERKRCRMRGYLAMLSVKKDARGKGIATHLLRLSLTTMLRPPPSVPPSFPPDEFVLETESDNREALGFYGKMGFVREKELFRFYLNGKRAARLKLDLGRRGMGVTKDWGVAEEEYA
ncbi:peptide alpha-N-acetyltransferase MAK3 [Sporobolomyces salmoneus]|uniref:peptide alpha-N-acetyltransferase MAK3 n=1 Tax=Sporobolomyces salmoneus TaxID=183962 RepID=UPI00316C84FA